MTTDTADAIRNKYKFNGIQHRVLAHLAKQDMDTYKIRDATKSTLGITALRAELNRMGREKLILSVGDDVWSITSQGLNVSITLGTLPSIPSRRRRAMDPNRISNGTTTETYRGDELGFTCHRPGAYDAFLLPSVMHGKRVYPNGRKEEL